jgi:hypothetical protein
LRSSACRASIMANPRGAGLSDQAVASAVEASPPPWRWSINSPGGSPVQSSLIAARIRRLAEEKGVPVHAFVEDVAASGGYWLASAADDIWVDDSSIVGSIGVISAGFGAHVFLARQGVERRVYTAGKSKSTLDPFRPEKKEDVARLKDLLGQMHETFIAQVKSRPRRPAGAKRGPFHRAILAGRAGGRAWPGRRDRAHRAQAEGALRRQRALCPSTGASVAFSSGLARNWRVMRSG